MGPAPVEIEADHAASDEEIEDLMDHVETCGHEETRAYAFDVELYSE